MEAVAGGGEGKAKSDGWMVEVLWLLECYSKRGKSRVPSNGSVAMFVLPHLTAELTCIFGIKIQFTHNYDMYCSTESLSMEHAMFRR